MVGRVWTVGLMVVWAPLAACGARTLGESEQERRVVQTSGGRGNAGSTGAAGGSNRRKPLPLDEGDPLGHCPGGFDAAENPDEPCNCLVEGVCFDSKYDACACICPRDSRANTCVSAGSPECEPGSRTKVSCYAL